MISGACSAACGWGQINMLSRQPQFWKKYVKEQISQLITLLFYQIILNPMAAHVLDWGDSLNQHQRGGKWYTTVWWCLWGELCWCSTEFLYYSFHRKPTGREFFIPAQTLTSKAVNSFTSKSVTGGTKTPSSPVCYVGIVQLSYVSPISHPAKTL